VLSHIARIVSGSQSFFPCSAGFGSLQCIRIKKNRGFILPNAHTHAFLMICASVVLLGLAVCISGFFVLGGCKDEPNPPPAPSGNTFDGQADTRGTEKKIISDTDLKPKIVKRLTEFSGLPIQDGVLQIKVDIDGRQQHTEFFSYNSFWQVTAKKVVPAGLKADSADDAPYIMSSKYQYDPNTGELSTITTYQGKQWSSKRVLAYGPNNRLISYTVVAPNPMLKFGMEVDAKQREVNYLDVTYEYAEESPDRPRRITGRNPQAPKRGPIQPQLFDLVYNEKGWLVKKILWRPKWDSDPITGRPIPVLKAPDSIRIKKEKPTLDDFEMQILETTVYRYDPQGRLLEEWTRENQEELTDQERTIHKITHEYNPLDQIVNTRHQYRDFIPVPGIAVNQFPLHKWNETHQYDDKGRRIKTTQEKNGGLWTITCHYES